MDYVFIQATNTHHTAYKLCMPPFTPIKNAVLMFVVLPWGGNRDLAQAKSAHSNLETSW